MKAPVERVLSLGTTARWGYPDGHMEIDVKLPWPVSAVKECVTLQIEAHEIPLAQDVMNQARAWLDNIARGR